MAIKIGGRSYQLYASTSNPDHAKRYAKRLKNRRRRVHVKRTKSGRFSIYQGPQIGAVETKKAKRKKKPAKKKRGLFGWL